MRCAYCKNAQTKVVDKRDTYAETRRRRECLKCSKRFTTYERAVDVNIRVVKKDGKRETFDVEKLRSGLLRACEKRPIPIEKVDAAVERIEAQLRRLRSKEIQSKVIGEKVLRELKRLDPVAFLRFASVYNDFQSVNDFHVAIKEIKR